MQELFDQYSEIIIAIIGGILGLTVFVIAFLADHNFFQDSLDVFLGGLM